MRAVIQRVSEAQVSVAQEVVGRIEQGLVVLLGIKRTDTEAEVRYLAEKILNVRCFSNADGKFDLSVLDVKGSILLVSQFTLYGDCRKGRRPSFTEAAPPEQAKALYDVMRETLATQVSVAQGQFQASMLVRLANDGPVTLILDTDER